MKPYSELVTTSYLERKHNKHFAILFYHVSGAYSEGEINAISHEAGICLN